jgi:hypothetical protein
MRALARGRVERVKITGSGGTDSSRKANSSVVDSVGTWILCRHFGQASGLPAFSGAAFNLTPQQGQANLSMNTSLSNRNALIEAVPEGDIC